MLGAGVLLHIIYDAVFQNGIELANTAALLCRVLGCLILCVLADSIDST